MHVIAIGLVVGTVLGGLALLVTRRAAPPALGWIAALYGLLALAATAAVLMVRAAVQYPEVSMVFSIAALLAGAGALSRGQKSWRTWAGLVGGGLPALFWLVFILAE